jgi:hypothetical protein
MAQALSEMEFMTLLEGQMPLAFALLASNLFWFWEFA